MSRNYSQNNKRVAKNTLYLYIRMIFTMCVSLYTSRVILNALGVEDYGVYNVVGGIVGLFTILSGSLSAAVSRYLTFELGQGNIVRLKKIFCTSVNVQLLIGLLIIVLVETVGWWFLNYQMDIPKTRLFAANVVLQISCMTFFINLLSIPYNAAIIAHEKMSAFAYIGICEALLKLLVAFLILWNPIDKLIYYAMLMAFISILIRLLYGSYCKYHFEECTYNLVWDKKLLRQMCGFAGWNFFGNAAYILNTQGVNMLINIFFGVTFNAAQGIASQAQAAILQFVNNFTTALNPQITKSYAKGDKDYLFSLICKGAKYTFFLLLIITLPFFVETEYILHLWLGTVPDYASVFLRLMLLSSYMTIIGNTALTAINATGKVKNYQLSVTLIGCTVFPLTWLFYYCGGDVTLTYYIYIFIYFLLIFVRLHFLKQLLNFPIKHFVQGILLRLLFVFLPAYYLSSIPSMYYSPTLNRCIISLVCCLIASTISILFFGLDSSERKFIFTKVKQIL